MYKVIDIINKKPKTLLLGSQLMPVKLIKISTNKNTNISVELLMTTLRIIFDNKFNLERHVSCPGKKHDGSYGALIWDWGSTALLQISKGETLLTA